MAILGSPAEIRSPKAPLWAEYEYSSFVRLMSSGRQLVGHACK